MNSQYFTIKITTSVALTVEGRYDGAPSKKKKLLFTLNLLEPE